jgi:DNA-binding protein HU-beta
MTKAELIEKIHEKTDLNKANSERALNACLESIEESLVNEGKLTLTGFGTFSVENRKERKGRNPQTGQEITIPASRAVKFRPGKTLRDIFVP